MDHVLDSFSIIFGQVDNPRCRFLKAAAACSLEERRASSNECAMYWVSFASTDNGQI